MAAIGSVQGIVTLVLALLCYWLFRLVRAQKTVVDTLTSQSAALKNLQDVLTRLYRPEEIENLVKAKVDAARHEYQAQIRDLEGQTGELRAAIESLAQRYGVYHLVAHIAPWYMTEAAIRQLIASAEHLDNGNDITAFLTQQITEIREAKRRALIEAGTNLAARPLRP